MKQELYINGEVVSYSLQRQNIVKVLGKTYIYKVPVPEDVLRIVYKGLTRSCGLTSDEFVSGFNNGKVWMSKKKGQYTLGMIYRLVQSRINEINRDYRR